MTFISWVVFFICTDVWSALYFFGPLLVLRVFQDPFLVRCWFLIRIIFGSLGIFSTLVRYFFPNGKIRAEKLFLADHFLIILLGSYFDDGFARCGLSNLKAYFLASGLLLGPNCILPCTACALAAIRTTVIVIQSLRTSLKKAFNLCSFFLLEFTVYVILLAILT